MERHVYMYVNVFAVKKNLTNKNHITRHILLIINTKLIRLTLLGGDTGSGRIPHKQAQIVSNYYYYLLSNEPCQTNQVHYVYCNCVCVWPMFAYSVMV